MPILPFLAMFFMVRKGFVYAVAVNFLCVLSCVLPHFALHFAPFNLAFNTKTQCVCGILPCILHQNAVHLAANCTWFCWKRPKSGTICGFMQCVFNFTCIYNHPTFAPKQTSARIEFLRQGWRLVDKKGTLSVKFLAEKFTAVASWRVER